MGRCSEGAGTGRASGAESLGWGVPAAGKRLAKREARLALC